MEVGDWKLAVQYHSTVAKINDVAKSAGVSTATVSRVLSNAAVVAPATRRRVMAAVERLGYAPNATAKNLRMLRTLIRNSREEY